MDVTVEPLLWEGGGSIEPGVPSFPPYVTGEGPQAVIDRRIWKELGGYDVYLGMIWHRMGTPTGDYRSGTEAEYCSAVRWHNESGRPSSILFYRKMAELPMTKLEDPEYLEQTRQALKFVKQLESKAGLVHRFSNENELEEYLHNHIPIAVKKALPGVHRVANVPLDAVPDTPSTRTLDTDGRLALVPPTVAAELRVASTDFSDETERLLRLLADETTVPEDIIAQLMAERPAWLTSAETGNLWAVVGEFARSHRLNFAARDAFIEAAGMGGADAPRWTAKAALAALAADLVERSRELLEEARTLSGGARYPFVELVEATIDKDLPAVIKAAQKIEDDTLSKMMRAAALLQLGRLDDAMAAYEELRESQPDNSNAALGIARVLLLRLEEGISENRISELEHARELALEARDLRRRWRGDSAEATVVAVASAALARDHSGVLAMALPPPEGEATDAEASHEEVLLRASYAALNLGHPQQGLALAQQVEDPIERALLEAACFESIPNSADLAKAAYERVVEDSTDRGQRIQAYYGLAQMGEWPLPSLEAIATEDPEEADLITAASEAARGDLDAAIRLCRGWRGSRRALEALVEFYGRADHVDDAVAALRDGAVRHRDPMLLAKAARVLAAAERYEEAEAEARAAMEATPPESRQHRAIRMLRIELSGLQGDWHTVEQLARAGIGDGGADVRWALVVALYNQHDLDEALRVMTRDPALEPRDEREAELAIRLYSQGPRSPDAVRNVLRLADRYKESEQVCAAAFMAAIEMSRDVELPADVMGQVRSLSDEFFERFPESTALVRIKFDDMQTLVDRLKELLAPGTEEYEETLNRVVIGSVPYGFLAAFAGRPYAEALIKRAAGFLPVAAADESIVALEQAAASSALGIAVVVETSALHVLGLLGLDPNRLLAEFGRVLVPAAVLDDAVAASKSLNFRSTGSMSWDPQQGKPVLIEIEDEQAEAWAQAAEQLVGRVRACEVVSPSSVEDPGLPTTPDAARPWLDPVELARERNLPLYSDDFVLRHAARSEGILAFGTTSLLAILSNASQVSSEDLEDATKSLRRNRAVDLPMDEEQVLALAAEQSWGPGPASFTFTRPALWRNPQPALTLYRKCITGVLDTDETLLTAWCSAATVGYGRSVPPVLATKAAGTVLAFTISTASFLAGKLKVRLFAPLLEASRAASRVIKAEDPLPAAAEVLGMILETDVGLSKAPQAFAKLVDGLHPLDRDTALRVYLRRSRP